MENVVIQTGSCYWMPADVGLSGADGVGETKTAIIKAPRTDIDIIGGITDLFNAQVLVTDVKGLPLWSESLVPILALFGTRDSAEPLRQLKRPQRLTTNGRLRAEVLNVIGESGGTLVFVGLPNEERPKTEPTLTDPHLIGEPFFLQLGSKFTSSALDHTSGETNPQDDPVVVWGAITDLNSALVRLYGADGTPWMSDFTPVWALAGRPAGVYPVMDWLRPYVIPPGGIIKSEFQNPGSEPDGSVYLVCQRMAGK